MPNPRSTKMKTQDQDTTKKHNTSLPSTHPKNKPWFTVLGAIIVVALIVTVSAVVFARLAQRHSAQTAPPPGKWESVLTGYTLTSLVATPGNPAVLYTCATTTAPDAVQSSTPTTPPATNSYTILRSTDFGTHWQDVGSKAGLGDSCQLTVNSADSNEVYVVTPSNTAPGSGGTPITLKHTTDGGQTWETIVPSIQGPGIQTKLVWYPLQLSMAGKSLFALQPTSGTLTGRNSAMPDEIILQLSRLITSTDGGHTWTVIDKQFQAAGLGVRSYAVDPSNPATIYELLGQPVLPIERANPETGKPVPGIVPPSGTDGDLYKTTNGGATWHLVLRGLFFGSTIQLASNKPQVIYAGGTISPLPLVAHTEEPKPTYPIRDVGSFKLQVSTDSGAHWRSIPTPPQIPYVQGWFAGPGGEAYVYVGSSSGGGQGTAVSGTAVPSGTAVLPPSTPQATPTATTGSSSEIRVPITTPPSAFFQNKIMSYDPTTNGWTDLPPPPIYGALLTVTPSSASGSAILWFAGTAVNGQRMLYRYVI